MKKYHTTAAHFKIFKKECRKWIDFFELNNWKVYFAHVDEPEIKNLAWCNCTLSTLTATLCLNTTWRNDIPNNTWVKGAARHEVIHLLLGRLASLAVARFTKEDEIDSAEEGLIHRIEYIIDKLGAR